MRFQPDAHLGLREFRLGARRCRAQQAGNGADQRLSRVARDLRERGVRFEHALLRVGDEQAFVQVLEEALGQILPLACFVDVADVASRADDAQRSAGAVALGHEGVQFEGPPAAVSTLHPALGVGAVGA